MRQSPVNMPRGFRHFRRLYDAVRFGRAYGFRVTSPDDPTGEKHARDFGARLLAFAGRRGEVDVLHAAALQAACARGDFRVRLEEDEDLDLSWDEDGRTRKGLDSGRYVAVGVILERRETYTNDRTGDQHEDWSHVDSCWSIIDTPERVAYLAQCYAADFLPSDVA